VPQYTPTQHNDKGKKRKKGEIDKHKNIIAEFNTLLSAINR
jgi:hypothetical protein